MLKSNSFVNFKTYFFVLFALILTCCSGDGGLNSTSSSGAGGGGSSKLSNNPNTNSLSGIHSSSGWGSELPITVYISEQIISENPDLVTQIQAAMNTWEKAVGKTLFNFNATLTTSLKGNDFTSLYQPLNETFNGLYFDFNWIANTGKTSAVLATTIWGNSASDSSLIVQADIRFNHSFYVFGNALTDQNQGDLTIVDMQSLATHELGHFLGLNHTQDLDPTQALYDPYSVMLPSMFIGPGNVVRKISSGDVARIRTIYANGDHSQVNQLQLSDSSMVYTP
ncbi:MAG: matrixin family metalloprotease [Silvanigrellaceae bacterium]|nr:matrixin family metalloprotease [Silvanigrellaceae bacterium]